MYQSIIIYIEIHIKSVLYILKKNMKINKIGERERERERESFIYKYVWFFFFVFLALVLILRPFYLLVIFSTSSSTF